MDSQIPSRPQRPLPPQKSETAPPLPPSESVAEPTTHNDTPQRRPLPHTSDLEPVEIPRRAVAMPRPPAHPRALPGFGPIEGSAVGKGVVAAARPMDPMSQEAHPIPAQAPASLDANQPLHLPKTNSLPLTSTAGLGQATPPAHKRTIDKTIYLEADESPIDYQAAARLQLECEGEMSCLGETVFDYADGYWRPISHQLLKRRVQAMLRRFRKPPWPDAFIYGSHQQVLTTIESFKILMGEGPLAKADHHRVIVFSNGTYDLERGELGDHDPNHGATYALALPYLEGAACPPELQAVIDRCYPPGAEPIIRAMIRWVVDPTIRYGQCFHLLGSTGSGKGLLLDFLRTLFPDDLHGDLLCPSLLNSPEKVHQFILGRRLVAFPDCPVSFREKKQWNTFYELIENKPVTTRKLYSGEAERARRLNCRFLLASTEPFHSSDGTDGFQRRTLTLCTLAREGEQDHRMAADLQLHSERYARIRGEAVSWALAMPIDEVVAILDGHDPDGLLEVSADEVALASDSVSLWADACLVPATGPQGPDTVVTDHDWSAMFEVFKAFCNINRLPALPLPNFQGQVRRVLGPKRCLQRAKEKTSASSATEPSRRRNLPRLDAGFMLRPRLGREMKDVKRHEFAHGGLKALAALPQARRLDGPTSASSIEEQPD